MRKLLFALIVLFSSSAIGQQYKLLPNLGIPVTDQGDTLHLAWAGGINAATFSTVDLNLDGILDLVVFEKDGDRVTTYLNLGTPNQVDYRYAPEYISRFPGKMRNWAMMYDYDCDGKEDIISYSHIITASGVTVYKNVSNSTDGLRFRLEYALLESKYGSVTTNLYVSPVNQPGLADVDRDGDMDILTFGIASTAVEFHQNMAMENFGRCDTLVYEMTNNCWGKFALSGLYNIGILNVNCRPTAPPVDPLPIDELKRHGGSCALTMDWDNDKDIDFINGDLLGDNLLYLENGGDTALAFMNAQDTAFPNYDVPVDLTTFPAAYYLDIDNDNAKDIVVCPCTGNISENFNNVLQYKNIGTTELPVLQYQKNTLFRDEMIEVGAGPNVSWFDVNKDGLMDMLIGNYGYFSATPPYESGISYYKNVGTSTSPAFELITRDFANLIAEPITGISPTFGDLDNDGDQDMIIGDSDGFLHYYIDTASSNKPASFTKLIPNISGVDVGQFATPFLYDVNRDLKLDLVIGERSGNLNYYENTGTQTLPSFTLVDNTFGGVSVNKPLYITGHSDPVMFINQSGNTELLVGSERGYIYQYSNIDGNIAGTFTLVDSIFENIIEKERTSIDRFDINSDGRFDLVIGNIAGGVTIYSYKSTVGIEDHIAGDLEFNIYPNPASDNITIQLPIHESVHELQVEVYNINGALLVSKTADSDKVRIDVSSLSAGLYFCRVYNRSGQLSSKKFIVNK